MAQQADSSSSARHGWKILLGAAVAAVAITAAVGYFSFRNDLSPEECQQLEADKNLALGYLENADLSPARPLRLAEADALFESIAAQRPGDPLGLRNLAITRLFELRAAKEGSDQDDVVQQARQAAQRLLASDDHSAVAHVLAGRIAAQTGDAEQAATELARAAELEPHDAAIWYEIYELLKDLPDREWQAKADAALGRAFEAAPDNLFIALAWAEAQAARKDPDIVHTLTALRTTLVTIPGVAEQVSSSTRDKIPDVLAWIDEAAGAAE
ncbi:MAG TPA: hypothetical protein VFW87_00430, partial [Pirellulales bacterium]|nr:hypothetical protein [Pirellulales bacterium]